MIAIAKMYNEGCSGPRGQFETTLQKAFQDSVDWSEGQIGHPWDGILVNVYENEEATFRGNPVETLDIRMVDGAWEVV
jgi:hypothetical protein